MHYKEVISCFCISFILLSCWRPYSENNSSGAKVLGLKPVYATETVAKKISYTAVAKPVLNGGNIYAFQNYIFQVEPGFGIHVIDNHIPAEARRIGFINVNGCAQISIKDNKLYTNSYDDLVVLDFSNLNAIKEYSRLKGAFAEYRYESPIAQPPTPGYYQCPSYDSLVVGWVKDSVYQSCYKN